MHSHTFVPDPSIYPLHYNTPEEEVMRDGFIAIASEVVKNEENYQHSDTTFLAGTELELPLINHDYTLATQEGRDKVVSSTPYTSVELSAHQLEVTPAKPADLKHDLMSLERMMEDSISSIRPTTRNLNLSWLRLGTYPLCHIHEVDHTKGDPKYIKYVRSPMWHTQNQRPDAEGYLLTASGPLDVSSGYIVGLLNAIQITVDATSFEDAIDKLNRSYMISPMAVALAANSSHLGYLYTGYADVRFVAWTISHDTRTYNEVNNGNPTRVGLPRDYFSGLNEYFNQILSYPFVMNDPISLEHPFEVGNGLFWRDARLKFFREQQKVGVEFRPVAIQPDLQGDMSVMMFYVGRLLWSQYNNETLTPMKAVWANKQSAMSHGMQAKLYTQIDGQLHLVNARTALEIEIRRANEGLALLGASVDKRVYYINSLLERLDKGSPAEIFMAAAKKRIARNIEDARTNLIETIEELNLIER